MELRCFASARLWEDVADAGAGPAWESSTSIDEARVTATRATATASHLRRQIERLEQKLAEGTSDRVDQLSVEVSRLRASLLDERHTAVVNENSHAQKKARAQQSLAEAEATLDAKIAELRDVKRDRDEAVYNIESTKTQVRFFSITCATRYLQHPNPLFQLESARGPPPYTSHASRLLDVAVRFCFRNSKYTSDFDVSFLPRAA
jgi:hypothetical protein